MYYLFDNFFERSSQGTPIYNLFYSPPSGGVRGGFHFSFFILHSSFFILHFLQPFLKILQFDAILDANLAHARPPKCRQIGSAVQRPTDVTRQRADVSAFAADDANRQQHFFRVKVEQLDFVDTDGLRQHFLLHLVAFPTQFIRPVSIDVHRAIRRRNLHHIADELRQRFFDQFPRDMRRRKGRIDFVFAVVTWRGCAELQRRRVFLRFVLQSLDLLRHLARAKHQNARRQRVERTGVTRFHSSDSDKSRNLSANTRQCPETRHSVGFVDGYDCSFYEIHQSTIASE